MYSACSIISSCMHTFINIQWYRVNIETYPFPTNHSFNVFKSMIKQTTWWIGVQESPKTMIIQNIGNSTNCIGIYTNHCSCVQGQPSLSTNMCIIIMIEGIKIVEYQSSTTYTFLPLNYVSWSHCCIINIELCKPWCMNNTSIVPILSPHFDTVRNEILSIINYAIVLGLSATKCEPWRAWVYTHAWQHF